MEKTVWRRNEKLRTTEKGNCWKIKRKGNEIWVVKGKDKRIIKGKEEGWALAINKANQIKKLKALENRKRIKRKIKVDLNKEIAFP